MERPEGTYPGLITLGVLALMVYVCFYFLHRWWVYRRTVSLVLVFICPGWLMVAALLNGDIPKNLFDALRWFSLIVTSAMVWAILQVEHRDGHRRNRRLEHEEQQRQGAHRL